MHNSLSDEAALWKGKVRAGVAQPAACGAAEQKIDPKWREYGQADDVIAIAQVSEQRIATAQRAREEVVLRRLPVDGEGLLVLRCVPVLHT